MRPFSHAELDRLAESWGESFYIFDSETFRRNWEDFRDAFRRIYTRTQLAYSYKTNYAPAICRYVDRWGGWAEVVSILEYELAIRLGVEPGRILFNGPYKRESHLLRAFEAGSTVNVDSFYEILQIERIARVHPELQLAVGLRCAFPVEGHPTTRFGLDVEGDEFSESVRRLEQLPNASLSGLHCHFMPEGRKATTYGEIARRMIDLTHRVFRDSPARFVDLGGGFFSRMPPELEAQFGGSVPDFADYAEALASPFAEAFPGSVGPDLILEPGMALIADAMQFVARVVDVKETRERRTALLAGSVYNVRPTKSPRNLPLRHVSGDSPTDRRARGPLDLVGYTCMEDDVLHRNFEGEIAVGDFVVFENVGAYTLVLKPPFILPSPPVLELDSDGGALREVRRAETLDDLFISYVL
jgi:diaminopimelate decarboxylase